VSPLIKRLEHRDLIRNRSDADECEVLVQLTARGREFGKRAESVQPDIRRVVGLDDATHDRPVVDLRRLTRQLQIFIN
jgi:DNA-binding MarR family transcriptional regulator